ncbi:MAG TPA: hypothetical protein VJN18_21480, partial [Polyangiaceae bacterium]|nr:hypothetical protein [Polyangiaceae bacterium]
MRVPYFSSLVVALGLLVLVPAVGRADEAADKRAEIARKKEEARKRAEERKAAADKAAADAKAAADKAAADAKAAAGGATGTGGAASTAAGGKASGGASSKGAGGTTSTTTKVEEKDAPLPAGDIETLRKDRTERRKATVERLRRRWGSVLANATGAADLKLHARRVAFLQRIRAVAEVKKDKKTVEAVDELLT